MASSEQAGPGRKRRRHIQHRLPVGDELLSKKVAKTSGALHGPDPFRPALGPAQEPFEHRFGCDHTQLSEQTTFFVERDGGVRRLVRIDPDGDHEQPPSDDRDLDHRGGQPDFKGSVSRLYRATPAAVGGQPARYEGATPRGVGKERGSQPVTDLAP